MAVDLPKVKSPSHLAHVFLKTQKKDEMVSFWKAFLGGTIPYEDEVMAFVAYDEEHHRIAIGQMPHTTPKVFSSSGLQHIAFTYDTLDDLALAYKQRLQLGMRPVWCVNHGPTTSIYYEDPDGNHIETQVDNFATPDEATEYMLTPSFRENPIGTDFNPEELLRRLESGEDHWSIKKRVDSGPRTGPPAAMLGLK